MIRLRFGKYALTLFCLVLVGMATEASHADLTKNQIKILETEFLPAWQYGDTWGILESLCNAIRTMDDEQLAELDQLLAAQQIPSSSQLLLQSRLLLLRQNLQKNLPRPGQRELLLTLEFIRDEVGSVINESVELIRKLEHTNANVSFDEFDGLLRDTHAMTQQLRSSIYVTQYAVEMLEAKHRIKVEALDEKQKELLESDFGVYVDELKTIQQTLGEREIVARIDRLKHAVQSLGQTEDDRKEKFLAAWSVSQDGELIRQALDAAGDVEFSIEVLKDEDLMQQISDMAQRGKELAGEELLTKSRLLFEGLNWWYRGRYGSGTEAMGLLKSPQAVHSDEAAFALMLPTETPEPTSPEDSSRYAVPEIDRRHQYIWAWEYRRVKAQSSSSVKTKSRKRDYGFSAELSKFY